MYFFSNGLHLSQFFGTLLFLSKFYFLSFSFRNSSDNFPQKRDLGCPNLRNPRDWHMLQVGPFRTYCGD